MALRDQDRAVGGVTLGFQSGQRLDADLHLAGQGRRPREPGPDQAMLGAGRDRDSLEVRRHGVGVAQGLEQVAAASQQTAGRSSGEAWSRTASIIVSASR